MTPSGVWVPKWLPSKRPWVHPALRRANNHHGKPDPCLAIEMPLGEDGWCSEPFGVGVVLRFGLLSSRVSPTYSEVGMYERHLLGTAEFGGVPPWYVTEFAADEARSRNARRYLLTCSRGDAPLCM